MSKPFSRTLYDQYNQLGIKTAQSFMAQMGYATVDDVESYTSHDFVVERKGKMYKVEAEVTAKWTDREFPYTNMSVPYRKRVSNADFYVRVNASGNALFFCPMRQVHEAEVITKNTCLTMNEKFFNVPVNTLTLYYLHDDEWSYDEADPICDPA
jgi:hypothetical protein